MTADEYFEIKRAIQNYQKFPQNTLGRMELPIETGRQYLLAHIGAWADLDAVTYEKMILIEMARDGTRFEHLVHWITLFN